VNTAGGSIDFGAPRALFRVEMSAPSSSNYCLTPDGHFIVNGGDETTPPLNVVVNWLKK